MARLNATRAMFLNLLAQQESLVFYLSGQRLMLCVSPACLSVEFTQARDVKMTPG